MRDIKRVGMVIGLGDERMEEYQRVHSNDHPGVRDLLHKYNLRNFSIFAHQLDNGKQYLFGYYEYVGDDFEGDMARLDAEPRNKRWLAMCSPMQQPFEGEETWAEMERIYYNP